MQLQYLPYANEYTWQQLYYPNGYNGYYMKPQGQTTWPNELPLTYGLGERFGANIDNGNYGRAAGDVALILPTMLTDALGNVANTAVNGYTRLYNDAATLYNNAAAQYNDWRTTTSTPQTSLTGRKIPAYTNLPTVQRVQHMQLAQPKKYLQGPNGEMVAQIIY